MKKGLLILLIGFLSVNSAVAQVQKKVGKSLSTKDFAAFKSFSDKLSASEKSVRGHWECLRDLTSEFQEGVFVFEKSVPDSSNPNVSSVYTFKVNIVATKTHITYYALSEKKNKKVGNDWVPYDDPIDTFKDEKLFDSLKTSFKHIYGASLNEKELFIADFVFGEHCGFAGVKPKGRRQIDEWVADRNKSKLVEWLTSTNTEKQVYAVDGLLQLKKTGMKLSDDELKIMKFVIGKSGTIYTCSGCIHMHLNIEAVTKEFKF